jgi:hypothetical protein
MLFPFAMQTLFFVQLTSIETRKVLEHIINYVIYKVLSLLYFLCPSAEHPKKKNPALNQLRVSCCFWQSYH